MNEKVEPNDKDVNKKVLVEKKDDAFEKRYKDTQRYATHLAQKISSVKKALSDKENVDYDKVLETLNTDPSFFGQSGDISDQQKVFEYLNKYTNEFYSLADEESDAEKLAALSAFGEAVENFGTKQYIDEITSKFSPILSDKKAVLKMAYAEGKKWKDANVQGKDFIAALKEKEDMVSSLKKKIELIEGSSSFIDEVGSGSEVEESKTGRVGARKKFL